MYLRKKVVSWMGHYGLNMMEDGHLVTSQPSAPPQTTATKPKEQTNTDSVSQFGETLVVQPKIYFKQLREGLAAQEMHFKEELGAQKEHFREELVIQKRHFQKELEAKNETLQTKKECFIEEMEAKEQSFRQEIESQKENFKEREADEQKFREELAILEEIQGGVGCPENTL